MSGKRMLVSDLPIHLQAEAMRQLTGKTVGMGQARANAIRAVEIVEQAPTKKRLRQSDSNGLNKLEADAWEWLKREYPSFEVIPHGVTLVLANGVKYTPDFAAFDRSNPRPIHCFEVKGPIMRDDASVKLKTAATKWTGIAFTLLWREGRNGPWKSQKVRA